MLTKFEKAFFDVAAGRVIFLCFVLAGGATSVAFRGHFIDTFPVGAVVGIAVWYALAYGLARRRRRNAEKQGGFHV